MKLALVLLAGALLSLFRTSLPTAQVPASFEVGKLRLLGTAMTVAAAEKGAAGCLSFYADDAVELPDGDTAVRGKEHIAKTIGVPERQEQPPGPGCPGKPKVQHGPYTTIGKKTDEQWRVVRDMGDSSPEPKGRGLR